MKPENAKNLGLLKPVKVFNLFLTYFTLVRKNAERTFPSPAVKEQR
jgi:hypothetical protein